MIMQVRLLTKCSIPLLIATLILIETNSITAQQREPESVESFSGLMLRTQLKDALHDETEQIRISPDGKYALAQDEDSINIVTIRPFAFLFRLPASQISLAQFTSDSQSIAFYTQTLQVHIWN